MAQKTVSIMRRLAMALCMISGVFIASCALFTHTGTLMTLPSIPGATYIGMETCGTCHAKETAEFQGAAHSAFTVAAGDEAKGRIVEGCEMCHGPGSLHAEDYEDKSKILKGDWPECFSCHLDKKTQSSFRVHHPVAEDRMTCTACHDPHK